MANHTRACPKLEHQDRGNHPHDGAEQHHQPAPSAAGVPPGSQRDALQARSPPAPRRRRPSAHGTIPVNTAATPIYRIVHTISVATIPIGTSRRGILALLARRRNRIEPDVGEEDDRPSCQHPGESIGRERVVVRRVDKRDPEEDTNTRIAAIFTKTIALLVRADSRIPRTSTTVSNSTTTNAGISKPRSATPPQRCLSRSRSWSPSGKYAGESHFGSR